MQRRRLQRAQLTEKRTYKMYKKGRLWLIAGLSTFTLGASLLPMMGRADTTSTTAEQQGTGTETTGNQVTLASKSVGSSSMANDGEEKTNNSQVETSSEASNVTASTEAKSTESTTQTVVDSTVTSTATETTRANGATNQTSKMSIVDTTSNNTEQNQAVGGTTDSTASTATIEDQAEAANRATTDGKINTATVATKTTTTASYATADISTNTIRGAQKLARATVATVATVNSATKTYDGKIDTPNRYTITLTDGTKAPSDWAVTSTASVYTVTDLTDVDTSKFGSSVGTYTLALSTAGITKLAEANSSADITAANVATGTLTIKQAPVPTAIITIGSASIDYGDAKPSTYTITVPSQYAVPGTWTLASSATDGTTNTYTIASSSGDVMVPTATQSGTYQLVLSDQGLTALQQANPNAAITADTIIAGSLVIAAHDIITMGATTIVVNKTTSTVPVTVNSRTIVVPTGWTIRYDDIQTDAIVYDVPVSDTTYSEAVNTAVVDKYTITLTDDTMKTLANLNSSTTFNSTTVGKGVVLVKASAAVAISPANYGAQASAETPVTGLTISHARTKGIDLAYGQALYLILPLINMNPSGMTVANLTDYVIIPSGFKVATNSEGAINIATDPSSVLTSAIEAMMTKNDVTYQGLKVTQLTDYRGRQTFKIHFDKTTVYDGGAFATLKYALLPVIAVQNTGVTSGLIGNQVSSPDSAVVYVTDDSNENNGSYSLNLQNYTNIDSVADALGIADAVTIGSGFTSYLYHYTLSAKTITDTYSLVGNDGTSLGEVTFTGDSGKTYVPMTKLPMTITQNGVTYYWNTSAVSLTQTYSGDSNSNYTVTYQRYVTTTTDTAAKITIAPASKVYDNNATTDPSCYTVYLPTEYTAPSDWTADSAATAMDGTTAYQVSTDYLNTTAIDQNVGTYAVTLNSAGMAALAAANPDFLIAGDVNVGGTLTITQRPVTITLPDTILWANGQEQNITPVITGVVAGQSLDYTLTSGLTDPDTTTITATLTNATANSNYKLTNSPSGQLTVGAVAVVYQYGYRDKAGTLHVVTTANGTATHGTDVTAKGYLSYTTSDTTATHAKTGYTLQPESTGYQADGTLADVGGQVVYTYLANTEKIAVVYVDQDKNNVILKQIPLSGSFGTHTNYTTAQDIAAYEKLGYVLASDEVPAQLEFDQDTEQTYYVYLKHGTITATVDQPGNVAVSDLMKTSQRTIHYVYADNTPTDLADVLQTVTYTRTATVDAVDRTVLSYGNWTTNVNSYPAIESPTITGYTADQTTIAAAVPASMGETTETTVRYSVNSETIRVQFVDGTTDNQVLSYIDLNGKYGDAADYTVTADIAKYAKLGYEPVNSDLPDQLIYKQNTQVYTVTLAHRHVTVSVDHPGQPGQAIDADYPAGPKYPAGTGRDSLEQTVTRTITYQYASGESAAETVNQSVTFNRTATFDMATGKQLTYGDWTVAPGQSALLAAVTSPTITGYQASVTEVEAASVTSHDKPHLIAITYTAKSQTATVAFVDVTSGKTLPTTVVTGAYGTTNSYSPVSQIAAYEKLGYRLVSNNVPTTGITFDQNDVIKSYTVKLAHQMTTVTPTKPGQPGQPVDPAHPEGPKYPAGTGLKDLTTSVQRVITYVYNDGQTAAPTVTQTVSFERKATFDQVTKVVTYTDWRTPESALTGAYAVVESPIIAGYTPNATRVASVTVSAKDTESRQTVTYQANLETATVTYVDATTGHRLGTSVTLTGRFGTQADYQPTTMIAQYTQAGYVLMGSDYPATGVTFNQAGVVQKYTVYLAHNKIVITAPDQLTKTITQTVHYQDQAGHTLQADTIRALTFTRSGMKDAVTGVATYRDWAPTGLNFTAVSAPTIAKYHALTATTQAVAITAASADDVQTLTYALDVPTPTKPVKLTKPAKPTKPTTSDDLIKPTTKPITAAKPTQLTKPATVVKDFQATTGNQTPAKSTRTLVSSRIKAVKTAPASAIIKPGSKVTEPAHKAQADTTSRLPQTGETRWSEMAAETLGLTLATLLLGFGGLKRKRHEK